MNWIVSSQHALRSRDYTRTWELPREETKTGPWVCHSEQAEHGGERNDETLTLKRGQEPVTVYLRSQEILHSHQNTFHREPPEPRHQLIHIFHENMKATMYKAQHRGSVQGQEMIANWVVAVEMGLRGCIQMHLHRWQDQTMAGCKE